MTQTISTNFDGDDLGDVLRDLADAANKNRLDTNDDLLSLRKSDTGTSISISREVLFSMIGSRKIFITARLTGWAAIGTSGKRWKYAWEEIAINEDDDEYAVVGGRHGGLEDSYALNWREMNNTSGASTLQGNTMELVAPIGGGTEAAPSTQVPVVLMERRRDDGSFVYMFEADNSDHIDEASTVTIGSISSDGGAEPIETTKYLDFETDQSGASTAGKTVTWNVMHRVGYFESGDENLYGYIRPINIRPNGKIRDINVEQRVFIDAPVDCP